MSDLNFDQASIFNVKYTQRLLFPHCFSDEILLITFRYVLVFPGKVQIMHDIDDSSVSNVSNHLGRCKTGQHTFYQTLSGHLTHSKRTHWRCKDFYSNESYDLVPKPSVNGLLQVNKRINRIATEIFFSENKFVFDDLTDAFSKAMSIGKVRARHIRDISFKFTSSGASRKYYHLIRVLPNLTNLSLYLNIREKAIQKNKDRNLKTCRGMKEMVHALSGLKEVNLTGTDWIEADPDTPGSKSRHVGVNHSNAAGPWIREKLMRPKEKFKPAKKATSIRPGDLRYPPVRTSSIIQGRKAKLIICRPVSSASMLLSQEDKAGLSSKYNILWILRSEVRESLGSGH